MDSARDVAKQVHSIVNDPKITKYEQMAQTILQSKGPLLDMTKTFGRYVAAIKSLLEVRAAMGDCVQNLAAVHHGKRAEHLGAAANFERSLGESAKGLCLAVENRLVMLLNQTVNSHDKEIKDMHKTFKKNAASHVSKLKKMEKDMGKAAKQYRKKPQRLDALVTQLTVALSDYDDFLATNLRSLALFHARKWNDFFDAFTEYLAAEIPFGQAISNCSTYLNALRTLTDIESTAEIDHLIDSSKPTAAIASLETVRQTGYYEPGQLSAMFAEEGLSLDGAPPLPPDDDDDDDDYDDDDDDDDDGAYGYSAPAPPPPMGGGFAGRSSGQLPAPTNMGMVRATRAFVATHDGELSFSAGEFFNLTGIVDDATWMGEMHGNTGTFPSSHVSRMQRAGG